MWSPTREDIKDDLRAEYDETLTIEEIDDGVYLIAASMDGESAGYGLVQVMKQSVLKKAREHCAQQNKAVKLVTRSGEGGSSSKSSGGGFVFGGVVGMGGSDASSAKGAEFDIVFRCRPRTAPAPTKDAS